MSCSAVSTGEPGGSLSRTEDRISGNSNISGLVVLEKGWKPGQPGQQTTDKTTKDIHNKKGESDHDFISKNHTGSSINP